MNYVEKLRSRNEAKAARAVKQELLPDAVELYNEACTWVSLDDEPYEDDPIEIPGEGEESKNPLEVALEIWTRQEEKDENTDLDRTYEFILQEGSKMRFQNLMDKIPDAIDGQPSFAGNNHFDYEEGDETFTLEVKELRESEPETGN